jgi:hypothetical protein
MATMIVLGTVAVGFALTPTSNEVALVMDEDASEFQYGDIVQEISAIGRECEATPDSTDGPVMTVSGAIYTDEGTWVSDETVGYHNHASHRALGVQSDTDTSCGLINPVGVDTFEALTLSLGAAVDGQMIESVEFDFEVRADSRMRIDYLDGTSVLFTEYYDLPEDATEVNHAPNGRTDSVRLDGPQEPGNIGTLFDGVRISMEDGRSALSGGASWDDPAAHRTVFKLTEAAPEISIDSTTNGTDGAEILVGEAITWSNLVTNRGTIALHDVEVVDTMLGIIPCLSSDLLPGESTTCSVDGNAEAGAYMNEATVSGTTPGGAVATAADTSSYYGLLGCGDSDSNGGPGFEDDPLGAFYNGPTKGGTACGAAVEITTTNTTGTGGEQAVDVAPPPGFTWDGVTGLLTIQWDVEVPTNDGIARTLQQLVVGDPLSEVVIPWCEQAIGITMAGGGWFYELDPVMTYPSATGSGDTCLVSQNTTTVDVGGDVFTQTTEVFYIWADPRLLRK